MSSKNTSSATVRDQSAAPSARPSTSSAPPPYTPSEQLDHSITSTSSKKNNLSVTERSKSTDSSSTAPAKGDKKKNQNQNQNQKSQKSKAKVDKEPYHAAVAYYLSMR